MLLAMMDSWISSRPAHVIRISINHFPDRTFIAQVHDIDCVYVRTIHYDAQKKKYIVKGVTGLRMNIGPSRARSFTPFRHTAYFSAT